MGSRVGYESEDFKKRGFAYEKLGNQEKAEENYQTAKLLEESRESWDPFLEVHFDYEKKTLIFTKRS